MIRDPFIGQTVTVNLDRGRSYPPNEIGGVLVDIGKYACRVRIAGHDYSVDREYLFSTERIHFRECAGPPHSYPVRAHRKWVQRTLYSVVMARLTRPPLIVRPEFYAPIGPMEPVSQAKRVEVFRFGALRQGVADFPENDTVFLTDIWSDGGEFSRADSLTVAVEKTP